MKNQLAAYAIGDIRIRYKIPPVNFCRKKVLISHVFDTIAMPFFSSLEKKWYARDSENNYLLNSLGHRIKIIPEDLKLNPLRVAVWFYDDGTNAPKSRTALLYTCNFSKKECYFLIDKLKELNISAYTTRHRNKSHIIAIGSNSYLDFIEMIKYEITCKTMEYKVDLSDYVEPYLKGMKLTKEEVIKIIEISKTTSREDTGKQFGVSATTITNIITGKTWKRLTKNINICDYDKKKRINEDDIVNLVACSNKYSTSELANMFNIETQTVRRILSGERWNKITGIK